MSPIPFIRKKVAEVFDVIKKTMIYQSPMYPGYTGPFELSLDIHLLFSTWLA